MKRLLKNRKALSPVISAVILIAVTLAVTLAAVSWMGSLSVSFMEADQLRIISSEWASDNSYIELTVKNDGTNSIIINTVSINGETASIVTFSSGSATLNAGNSDTIRVTHNFVSTATYEFKIISMKGIPYTHISIAPFIASQVAWLGDGSDGPLIISSANQIINNYTYLIDNELSEDTVITVNNSSGFSTADEILIIQIQNSSGGTAGTYEFKQIASINGNDITLSSALISNYYSGDFDRVGATVSQVVRVPQYTSVTINSDCSITAPAWNGYCGGIVAFRASGTIILNSGGKIDVSGKGYRGGAMGTSYNKDGVQGESYLGKGIGGGSYGLGKLNNAGGGGAYICGGGGEYGGYATDSNPWTGSGDTYARKGIIYGTTDLTKIFFGSGGGGQWDGSDTYGLPSDGGDGGGIIIIYANSIQAAEESLLSNGETTSGIQQGSYTYGSSGGAGGSIFLHIRTMQGTTNFCKAVGGLGNHAPLRDGGDGGVGRIRLDYNSLVGSTNPLPGYSEFIP